MLVQFIVALFVLRTKAGFDIFSFVSQLCSEFLGFANQGVIFLTDKTVPKKFWFLTSVVPPIIFFVSDFFSIFVN
jgi:CNT family concentrative nucleoside transporter